MPDLYTVSFGRKHFVTKFDAKGKATRTETMIQETYHDLPAQTAEHYRTTLSADANCTVVRQIREIGKPGSFRAPSDSRRTAIDHEKFSGNATKKVVQPPQKPQKSGGKVATKAAAPASPAAPRPMSADYGDLVNKLARKA